MKKILMMTDLEGAAGVVSFEDQIEPNGRYYETAKKLLTAEVNAAIAGLLEAGVDEVLVVDGHGAGGICFEELHPAARLLHGHPLPPWRSLAKLFETYDACMMIGQHAMTSVPISNNQGSLAVDYYQLNGRKVGEIAQFALFCGAMGVPLIFLSGEEDACREAQEFVAGVVTAPVKQGLGRGVAISMAAPEARHRIYAGAKRAIERQHTDPIPPLVWKGLFVLDIRYFSSFDADTRAAQPGVERLDAQTVRITSPSIIDIIYC